MVSLVLGQLKEKGASRVNTGRERGGHSGQGAQPGKGSVWGMEGGCLEVKHMGVGEPQGCCSGGTLVRVNVSPLSATGGSLASSTPFHQAVGSSWPVPCSPSPGNPSVWRFSLTGPEPALVLPAGLSHQAGGPFLLRVGCPACPCAYGRARREHEGAPELADLHSQTC